MSKLWAMTPFFSLLNFDTIIGISGEWSLTMLGTNKKKKKKRLSTVDFVENSPCE